MSRKRVNSGWVYGHHSMTATSTLEGTTVGFDTLLSGVDLRIDGGVPLVGERADYFVERLLLWGELDFIPSTPAIRYDTMCNVRVGTIATEEIAVMTDNLLFSEANSEFWGRILQDVRPAAYVDPAWTFNGVALVVDDGVVATERKAVWPTLGPSHFMLDIQQRFSLQREEDRLIVALCEDSNYFEEGNQVFMRIAYKMLVKEYRK